MRDIQTKRSQEEILFEADIKLETALNGLAIF